MQDGLYRSGIRRRDSTAPRAEAPGTVLIVEDDPGMRATFERMVTRGGWDAISVDDPQLALTVCIDERPAAVLSDYDMPILKGDHLAILIHKALGDSAPPIVIVSGTDPVIDELAQIAFVLSKPVSLDELHGALEDAIDGDARGSHPAPE